MISVIIPAANEQGWIGPCLDALFASDPVTGGAEVILAANGCRDGTLAEAEARRPLAEAAGWRMQILDLPPIGKIGALNAADAAATGDIRVYLDADIRVSPQVMAGLAVALAPDRPLYASARPRLPVPRRWASRGYARIWQQLPFFHATAPGFGLYAVNAKGRARWGEFPAVIADDSFVRGQFRASERVEVAGHYDWPLIEGFAPLVKVRKRQDAGVRELTRLYPETLADEGKARLGAKDWVRIALRDPVGFSLYAAVLLAARLGPAPKGWTRGR